MLQKATRRYQGQVGASLRVGLLHGHELVHNYANTQVDNEPETEPMLALSVTSGEPTLRKLSAWHVAEEQVEHEERNPQPQSAKVRQSPS